MGTRHRYTCREKATTYKIRNKRNSAICLASGKKGHFEEDIYPTHEKYEKQGTAHWAGGAGAEAARMSPRVWPR